MNSPSSVDSLTWRFHRTLQQISRYHYRTPSRMDLRFKRVRFASKPGCEARRGAPRARNKPSPTGIARGGSHRALARDASRCIFRTVLLTVPHICISAYVCCAAHQATGLTCRTAALGAIAEQQQPMNSPRDRCDHWFRENWCTSSEKYVLCGINNTSFHRYYIC